MATNGSDSAEARIEALDGLLREHDYRGWDPFDLPNSPLLAWLPERWWAPQLALSKLGSRALPDRARRLLRVPEIEDPKIYACAYFGYRAARTEAGDARAADMARRLAHLADRGPEGAHWGYDYTWATRGSGVNPRKASTMVPGAFAILALLHDAVASGDGRRDLLSDACDYYAARHLCAGPAGPYLGYFAGVATNTHNANLLGCVALSLVGRVLDRPEWLDVAARAAATSVFAVDPEGYLPYNDIRTGRWTDCYHHLYATACTLALADANPGVDRDAFVAAAERMTGYARREFLREDGLVNYFPGKLHPVDPHNYAAAAIFVVLYGERLGIDPALGRQLLRRVDELMWDAKAGRYLFRRHARRVDGRLFVRWTQAWMFAAWSIVQSSGAGVLVPEGAGA